MFIDMEQDAAIVSLFVHKERKFLIASSEGRGFRRQGRGLRRQHPQGQAGCSTSTMPNEACAIATVRATPLP